MKFSLCSCCCVRVPCFRFRKFNDAFGLDEARYGTLARWLQLPSACYRAVSRDSRAHDSGQGQGRFKLPGEMKHLFVALTSKAFFDEWPGECESMLITSNMKPEQLKRIIFEAEKETSTRFLG